MSQAFLFTSWNCDHDVAAYLPFEPRQRIVEEFGEARLQIWPLREGPEGNGHVMDGWIDAPSSRPTDASVAAAQELIRTYAGEFAALSADENGHVVAWCDFLGGRHIYYRFDGQRLAISNRAMLAAAAFGTPEIEPIELSWFMASIACPFTENTAWRGVKILEAGGVLQWNGRLETYRTEIEPQTRSWDVLWEELCHRVEHLTAGRTSRMALTGGLDSRVVLAAAVGSGTVSRLEHAYLRGCSPTSRSGACWPKNTT